MCVCWRSGAQCHCQSAGVPRSATVRALVYRPVPLSERWCTAQCHCQSAGVPRSATVRALVYCPVPLSERWCTAQCHCQSAGVPRSATVRALVYRAVPLSERWCTAQFTLDPPIWKTTPIPDCTKIHCVLCHRRNFGGGGGEQVEIGHGYWELRGLYFAALKL